MGGIAGAFLTLLAQVAIGGVAAMLVVPMGAVGSGFSRTSTGVYFGVTVLAIWGRLWLLGQARSRGAAWGQILPLLSHSATFSLVTFGVLILIFLISLWGPKPIWSRRCLLMASAVGFLGLGLDALALARDPRGLEGLALLLNSWLSSALLGLTFTGMLLGHWYLNEPGLPTRYVQRMAQWFLAAVLAQGIFPVAHGLLAVATGEAHRAQQVWRVIPEHPILFGARVVIGILATLVVALVIRNTLRIPNVQSATGFFYIAILTVLLGEVLGRALLLVSGVPF